MKKVLVLHTWGMGDMIMATPMLRSLFENGYQVDLIVTTVVNLKIMKNADFIHKIFLVKNIFQYLKFAFGYDYLIVTTGTNLNKIKFLNLIIMAKNVLAGTPKKNEHRIVSNLNIINSIVTHKTDKTFISIEKDSNVLDKYITSSEKVYGFAIGSGSNQKFKRWPIDKWISLIEHFDGIKLVFIGPDEVDLQKKLLGIKNIMIVLENLEDTIQVINSLDCLVGTDNGVMHIGYALGIKTFTLFGMTNPLEIGGYNKSLNHNISLNLSCAPCFHSENSIVGCNTLECLNNISAEYVYDNIVKNTR